MSLLRQHAETELALLGGHQDEMQRLMNQHVLAIVDLFSRQGHSGFSASYAISVLEKLLRYEPLTPLTGDDSEWEEVGQAHGGDKRCWQNKRCSHVFRDVTGAYDSEGRIFREQDGSCFQNRESRVYITFPYTPKREYVEWCHD